MSAKYTDKSLWDLDESFLRAIGVSKKPAKERPVVPYGQAGAVVTVENGWIVLHDYYVDDFGCERDRRIQTNARLGSSGLDPEIFPAPARWDSHQQMWCFDHGRGGYDAKPVYLNGKMDEPTLTWKVRPPLAPEAIYRRWAALERAVEARGGRVITAEMQKGAITKATKFAFNAVAKAVLAGRDGLNDEALWDSLNNHADPKVKQAADHVYSAFDRGRHDDRHRDVVGTSLDLVCLKAVNPPLGTLNDTPALVAGELPKLDWCNPPAGPYSRPGERPVRVVGPDSGFAATEARRAATTGTPPSAKPPSGRARMEQLIRVVADSVGQLRKSDVFRVLDECPKAERSSLAAYISLHRADYQEAVRVAMEEVQPASQKPAPPSAKAPLREIQAPIINLNGSGKRGLVEQYALAAGALDTALGVLAKSGPPAALARVAGVRGELERILAQIEGRAPVSARVPQMQALPGGRREVLERYEASYDALNEASRAVGESAPNGRDYYVQAGAFDRAVKQHDARLDKLSSVLKELDELIEPLQLAALREEEKAPPSSHKGIRALQQELAQAVAEHAAAGTGQGFREARTQAMAAAAGVEKGLGELKRVFSSPGQEVSFAAERDALRAAIGAFREQIVDAFQSVLAYRKAANAPPPPDPRVVAHLKDEPFYEAGVLAEAKAMRLRPALQTDVVACATLYEMAGERDGSATARPRHIRGNGEPGWAESYVRLHVKLGALGPSPHAKGPPIWWVAAAPAHRGKSGPRVTDSRRGRALAQREKHAERVTRAAEHREATARREALQRKAPPWREAYGAGIPYYQAGVLAEAQRMGLRPADQADAREGATLFEMIGQPDGSATAFPRRVDGPRVGPGVDAGSFGCMRDGRSVWSNINVKLGAIGAGSAAKGPPKWWVDAAAPSSRRKPERPRVTDSRRGRELAKRARHAERAKRAAEHRSEAPARREAAIQAAIHRPKPVTPSQRGRVLTRREKRAERRQRAAEFREEQATTVRTPEPVMSSRRPASAKAPSARPASVRPPSVRQPKPSSRRPAPAPRSAPKPSSRRPLPPPAAKPRLGNMVDPLYFAMKGGDLAAKKARGDAQAAAEIERRKAKRR